MFGVSFTMHRRARFFFDPACDLLAVFGHLSYGRPHAPLTHAVRATEVELKAVCSGIFCALNNIVPGFALAFDHERRDDYVVRIPPLCFRHLLQIDLDGAVGDELDIIEAHHAVAVPVDGGIA